LSDADKEGEAIHDLIEHLPGRERCTGSTLIAAAPMTHSYGKKGKADTYRHNAAYHSFLKIHERPRSKMECRLKTTL
jgi:hypothetical protein